MTEAANSRPVIVKSLGVNNRVEAAAYAIRESII
jgi:DNA-binding NarL/FixJ family response regulator